ncbi:MAG: type I DNA topoisomerase [Mycobacteriales bacterium]
MPTATRRSAEGNPHRLVIVESPAKARTISGYLGSDYVVESSIGHIRDLPSSAAEIPASAKKAPWARLGVDVEHGFKPLYVVAPEKKAQVAKLKKALAAADELLLATDEDREGEAIAWHLLEVLQPKIPVRRMVFHEITPAAIREAVAHPRDIDRALVEAQETRRILDRLYGYEVSPVLWKKVMPRLSAGRVQSVATRILVERERARMAFRAANFWDIEATLETQGPADGAGTFTANLTAVDGARVATGRDFGPDGRLRGSGLICLDAAGAQGLAERLTGAPVEVVSLEQKPYRRSPYPPFMTSTLQQEAGRKLRLSSQTTMRLAQRLYEGGYITYMRTDSTTLSETALTAARDQARELFGPSYVPDRPRRYEKKVKNAQEAHEAIRPAGDRFRTPSEVAGELSRDEARIYELIWTRTVASQMADATGSSMSVRLTARSSTGEQAQFSATGKTISFPGFLRAYVEGSDDPDGELEDRERPLPPLREGQRLTATSLQAQSHTTTSPPRYTEASLVKALEEMGVGRPSTYASIIATIQDRGYVFRRGQALVPSFTAFAVVGLLERHFGKLVDYNFTAAMEDDLDEIASGRQDAVPWLTRFYFGETAASGGEGLGPGGLKAMVSDQLAEIDAREVNSILIGRDELGRDIVVRVGRYGPYLQRGEERASVPEDLPPDELTLARAEELLSAPSGDKVLGSDPDTGVEVVARSGRYGPYVATVPPQEWGVPARTASLLSSQSVDSVTLDEALALLSLPRELGSAPDGEVVTAQNGRYGPYVKKGAESRSLDSEDKLFTVTLEEALGLFAQPRQRGRRAAAEPLAQLGSDPATGRAMVVKEGRFGLYVTDGETNASLRKGDSVDTLTAERAAELLADRRARGPATPKRRGPAAKRGSSRR